MATFEGSASRSSGGRIILLTQWFDPEPTIKGLDFARELNSRGFEIEVVTGFPNYPGGKIYPGYRLRPFTRETHDGVRVMRLPLYPSHDSSGLRRALNYVSFAVSALVYMMFFSRRAQAIYVYHPPVTAGLVAAIVGIFRRTPLVIDIQDLWPDTLAATGMVGRPSVLRLVGAACDWLYRRCAGIAVLSPGFRTELINRGVAPEKIAVIPNWAPSEATAAAQAKSASANATAAGRPFSILFAGNVGMAQGLDNLLEAASLVDGEAIEIVILGDGVDLARIKASAVARGLSNIRFLPKVPFAEAQIIQSEADCLLIHLRRDPLFAITIPSKTQSYMAAGKPILVVGEGDVVEIIQSSGAGLAVPPDSPAALATALREFAAMSSEARACAGRASREYYDTHFARRHGVDKFAALLDQVKISKRMTRG